MRQNHDRYFNLTQSKYSYIFNFFVEQRIDEELVQSRYFNWLYLKGRVTTKQVNQHANSSREYKQVCNLYDEYIADSNIDK